MLLMGGRGSLTQRRLVDEWLALVRHRELTARVCVGAFVCHLWLFMGALCKEGQLTSGCVELGTRNRLPVCVGVLVSYLWVVVGVLREKGRQTSGWLERGMGN